MSDNQQARIQALRGIPLNTDGAGCNDITRAAVERTTAPGYSVRARIETNTPIAELMMVSVDPDNHIWHIPLLAWDADDAREQVIARATASGVTSVEILSVEAV